LAIISAGTPQLYTTTAYDAYDNEWAVTGSYTANGTIMAGNSITETAAGQYIITTTFNSKTASTTLTVNPANVDNFQILAPSLQ
jgi:hypothetical protein